jgi:hypothetical protein
VPDLLSATVLLRPAAGGTVGEAATAATVEQTLPDPDAATRAERFFRDAGFEVVAPFGASFSIVGPKAQFERIFGTPLVESGGGVRTADGTLELPLEPLPPDVAGLLQAVTFTPPPDFGPTSYA